MVSWDPLGKKNSDCNNNPHTAPSLLTQKQLAAKVICTLLDLYEVLLSKKDLRGFNS